MRGTVPVPSRPRRFFLDLLCPPKSSRPLVPPPTPPPSASALATPAPAFVPAYPAIGPSDAANLPLAADLATECPPTSSPEPDASDVDGKLATDESVSARGPTDIRPLTEPPNEVSELVTEPARVRSSSVMAPLAAGSWLIALETDGVIDTVDPSRAGRPSPQSLFPREYDGAELLVEPRDNPASPVSVVSAGER